jgi:hypothetical protein
MQIAQMDAYLNESRPALAEAQREQQETAPPGELPAWAGPAILIALFLASVIQVVGSITL